MLLPDVIYLKLFFNGLIISLCMWGGSRYSGSSISTSKEIVFCLLAGPLIVFLGGAFLSLWGKSNFWTYVLLLEVTPGMSFIFLGYALIGFGLIATYRKFREMSDPNV